MSALLKPASAGVDLASRQTAPAALRTFFRLAEAWQLGVADQSTLLGVARTTLCQWKQGKVAPLDRHLLERLSHLFGIYSSLHILYPVAERADAWVKKPNTAPLFAGRSALDRMLGGQVSDLWGVHQYLDAQRGGKT